MPLVGLLSMRIASRSALAGVLLAASLVAPVALSSEDVSALGGSEVEGGGGGIRSQLRK